MQGRNKKPSRHNDNQTVFAKSKLDVGKFPDFTVSLEIEAEIPAEKQRFMSEEKLAYCERTFDEFEKLGLVQECHSPKTVANLLLVPKYEGLRDLWRHRSLVVTFEDIVNKSANGLGVSKSENSVAGRKSSSLYIVS